MAVPRAAARPGAAPPPAAAPAVPPRLDGPAWTATSEERAILLDPRRLSDLRDAELLDVPPIEEFDRLTSLLARTLGVPVAILTVVDAARQYFLSGVGLPATVARSRETSLAGSFCKHVLLDDAPLVIPDAASDARVRGNTSIDALGVAAYLGVPVHAGDGVRVGALCAIDHVPRAWTDADRQVVTDAARVATALLDARLRRAEAERERREKLDVLARISEGFVTLDREWRVTFANASAARLASCAAADAIGRTLWELLPPLADSSTGTWLRARMGSIGVYEHEWAGVANAGWFEMRVVCSSQGMSLYVRDITRRKRTEVALAASEARYRELTNVAPVGIFETDTQGACTWINRTFGELSDLQPHEAAGDGWLMAVHPDDRPRVAAEWFSALTERREFCLEYRFRHGDGTVRWIAGRASPAHDDRGEITGVIGTVADITERKAVEEQLRQVNERLELALSGSDIGLWDWDIRTGLVHFNDWLPGMLGYSVEEFPATSRSGRRASIRTIAPTCRAA
ncbi:MAG: PAS domain S-box protein [Gemmatimonadetes bacterium]|nr:PAS domain S-box protein [Gemmatimonadota bacterium]